MQESIHEKSKIFNILFSCLACENVRRCGYNFHGLLGSLPHLFHLLLPQSQHHQDSLHLAHLLGFLLVEWEMEIFRTFLNDRISNWYGGG